MIKRQISVKNADRVSVEALTSYVSANGYIFREHWGAFLDRFSKKAGGREDNVIVPRVRHIDDYERRIAEAVETLANQTQRDVSSIFRALVNDRFEVVRIKVNEGEAESTIGYDAAIELLSSGYALVDSAATVAVSNFVLTTVRGRRPDAVRDFLDGVRVGQTEVGSFVLTLLLPTGQSGDAMAVDGYSTENLGTRVVNSLSEALLVARDAAEAGLVHQSPHRLASRGLTSNFSGALARMIEAAGDVTISVSKKGKSKDRQIDVQFRSGQSQILKAISDSLRPAEKEKQFEAVGPITRFQESRDKTSGVITIACVNDVESRSVRVKFGRADRAMVVQAIDKKASMYLSVKGTLTFKNSYYSLEDPTEFELRRRGPLA